MTVPFQPDEFAKGIPLGAPSPSSTTKELLMKTELVVHAAPEIEARIEHIRQLCIGLLPDAYTVTVRDVRFLLDQLRAALSRAPRTEDSDTERLDWIEAASASVSVFDPPSGDAWVWEVYATGGDDGHPIGEHGISSNLREAIDAAMSTETSPVPTAEKCPACGAALRDLASSSEPEGLRLDEVCDGCGRTFMCTKAARFELTGPVPKEPK